MHEIFITCREAATAAIALIPAFLLLDRIRIHNRKRSVIYLLFSIYLSAMYAAVGLPDITYYRFWPHINLIPFQYMFTAWESTLLNVLMFFPLGFFLPLLWCIYGSFLKTVFFGFFVSLFIEVMQIFTYRATDINDLMTNTFGTMLGFVIGKLALKAFPSIRPGENTSDLALVCSVSFSVMFFIYPFFANIIF